MIQSIQKFGYIKYYFRDKYYIYKALQSNNIDLVSLYCWNINIFNINFYIKYYFRDKINL